MDKAVQWGIDALKAAGADRVSTEDFPIAASWAEGATEMKVVAPESFHLRAVSVTHGLLRWLLIIVCRCWTWVQVPRRISQRRET